MFLYHGWLSLPINTRVKVAEAFGIKKKGATEVFNNTIKSDGYLVKDIELALSVENMQKYLNTTDTNATLLWNLMVDKIEGRETKVLDIGTVEVVPPINPEPIITSDKPRGRPKKNA